MRILTAFAALFLSCLSLATDKPNILWVSAEDHGPHLGCYGDDYATTPNLDAFAARSLRYEKASSNAPVCAPARTTIISGMYPTTLGAYHMRSAVPLPDYLKFFPRHLQQAGYYTTNNGKEDYNLRTDDKGWHESSTQAHWRNRPQPEQPFFAVFNYANTHESRLRDENPNPIHDPDLVSLPPYHPDLPEVRNDWAQYYDRITQVDKIFQARLDELEQDGLADETIVVYWSDHGSGMPRSKRYPGWSGLHVPLIVHIPEKFRHLASEDYLPGGASQRLVSFVDLAPTMLSLAGLPPAPYHQGHAFLGRFQTDSPAYSFGFKGRMDERPDECRSVTDGRYIYIRNYLPHLPHGQYLVYQQRTDTTRLWYQLFQDDQLNDAQAAFWLPHPREELFDLQSDPHETRNLAASPAHQDTLKRLRAALDKHEIRTRDLGFLPEPLLRQAALAGISPETAYQHYFRPSRTGRRLDLDLSTYWRLTLLLSADDKAIEEGMHWIQLAMLDHEEPIVRLAAAQLLAVRCKDGVESHVELRERALQELVTLAAFPENELILSIYALNALEQAQNAGATLPASITNLQAEHPDIPRWARSYRPRLLNRLQPGD